MPKRGEVSTNFFESLISKEVKVILPDGNTGKDDYAYKGTLISFDEFTIIINDNFVKKHLMIFKHAIESICEV